MEPSRASPALQRGVLGEQHAPGHARPRCGRDAKPPALINATSTGHVHTTCQQQQTLCLRLQSKSGLPGLDVCWVVSVLQDEEDAELCEWRCQRR